MKKLEGRLAHRLARSTAAIALAAGAAAPALAGGSPEHALLVIDPNSAVSLYVGNYYKKARNIPDANVLYLDPDASAYVPWTQTQLEGFLGQLAQRRIDGQIDYVIVTPGNSFFVAAPGLISDGCFPVSRFSISSVFTMAHIKGDILGGGLTSQHPNFYFSLNTAQPFAFSSATTWLGGSPSTSGLARRYFIGGLLGYTGENGNTLAEVLAMIDRSVQSDGSNPTGTFFFMDNTGDPARNVRAPQFPQAVTALTSLGATAQTLVGIVPPNGSICNGVMTGASTVNVSGLTLRPGSFADHMTSFACTFSSPSQTKASEWIRAGASGSSGTVEEPCNYVGKFNNPRLHAFYYQGMSLGEAYLRSMQFVPFQGLLLGDPLTRPFARFPTVSLVNPPSGPVAGTILLTPSGSAPPPAAIGQFDLYIDGVRHSTVSTPGGAFTVNTTLLADGWHDLRVLAEDSTPVKTIGRWTGSLLVNNLGRTTTLNASPGAGNLTKVYTFDVNATGADIREIRLLHNGRVVGARTTAGPIFIWGQTLGAGDVSLMAETEFTDGRLARSQPASLSLTFDNGPLSGLNPVAFSYRKVITVGSSAVVELPATFDDDPADATYTIVTQPTQGTLSGTGAWRVLKPGANACGLDTIVFRVQTPQGQSGNATISLRYAPSPTACIPDFNGDGVLNLADFGAFQTAFALNQCRADVNGDGILNLADFGAFQTLFALGCP